MEEISNLNIAITTSPAGGNQEIGRIAYLARTIELSHGQEQIIGTTPETLEMVPSVPTFMYIYNVGSTTVIVDSVSTMNAFPQIIIPRNGICLSPETSTIYARSIDFNGKIWVMSVY